MNWSKGLYIIGVSGILNLTACFDSTGADSNSAQSIVPDSEAMLFELPSSIATGSAQGMGRTLSDSEEEHLFDAYKPIPAYIGLTEAARNGVATIINNLSQKELPDNFEWDKDGESISSKTLDSLEHTWKVVHWKSEQKNEELHLRFWKNEANEYRGHATFSNTIKQESVEIAFNTHDSESLGKRMEVRFFKNASTLDEKSAPSVLAVKAVKKNTKVWVSGFSYHPTFQDDEKFWYDGAEVPSVYAFATAANVEKDVAVLRAAFAPADSVDKEVLTKWALDNEVLENAVRVLQKESLKDSNMLKAYFWSLENKKPIEKENWLAIAVYKTDKTQDDINMDNLTEFSNIQLKAENPEKIFWEISLFARAKQPIFLHPGAVIKGNKEMVDEASFGIESKDIDAPEMEEMDFHTILESATE